MYFPQTPFPSGNFACFVFCSPSNQFCPQQTKFHCKQFAKTNFLVSWSDREKSLKVEKTTSSEIILVLRKKNKNVLPTFVFSMSLGTTSAQGHCVDNIVVKKGAEQNGKYDLNVLIMQLPSHYIRSPSWAPGHSEMSGLLRAFLFEQTVF